MPGPIHIALTFDDDFWAPAYATMRSICLATSRRREVIFHLIHWHLTDKHRAMLEGIPAEFGAALRHHRLEDDEALGGLLGRLPRANKLPPIVFARLFLTNYVPEEAARFLFLDSDLYVRAPIEQLVGIDLQGRAIAAAPEPGRQHLMLGDDMKGIGKPFASWDRYFNAGVLVVDRARWVAADLPGRLDGHIVSGLIERLYQDQDVLNLAFRDDWLALDPRWNLTKPHPALRSLDPFIVHYTTEQKPWNILAYVAFGSSYKHVMTRAVLARYRRERWARRLSRLFGRHAP